MKTTRIRDNYEDKYNTFLEVCIHYLGKLRYEGAGYVVEGFDEFSDVVDNHHKNKSDKLRESALAKLTDEEKKALGL